MATMTRDHRGSVPTHRQPKPGPPTGREDAVQAFLASIPLDTEGPERALEFRRYIAKEPSWRVIDLYQHLSTEATKLRGIHDVYMVISCLSERLELLPLVRPHVERFLTRACIQPNSPAFGLWRYLQELHRCRARQTSRQSQSEELAPTE